MYCVEFEQALGLTFVKSFCAFSVALCAKARKRGKPAMWLTRKENQLQAQEAFQVASFWVTQ
jgi:hypothetical protein